MAWPSSVRASGDGTSGRRSGNIRPNLPAGAKRPGGWFSSVRGPKPCPRTTRGWPSASVEGKPVARLATSATSTGWFMTSSPSGAVAVLVGAAVSDEASLPSMLGRPVEGPSGEDRWGWSRPTPTFILTTTGERSMKNVLAPTGKCSIAPSSPLHYKGGRPTLGSPHMASVQLERVLRQVCTLTTPAEPDDAELLQRF